MQIKISDILVEILDISSFQTTAAFLVITMGVRMGSAPGISWFCNEQDSPFTPVNYLAENASGTEVRIPGLDGKFQ